MEKLTCSVDGCEKPQRSRAWCQMHYSRWRKHGDVNYQTRRSGCTIEGCARKHEAKGYCATHYLRAWQSGGSPERPCGTCGKDIIRLGERDYCDSDCRPACSVEVCTNNVQGKGPLCRSHQMLLSRNGRLPEKYWQREKLCLVCGATEWADNESRRYCSPTCQGRLYRDTKYACKCAQCGTDMDLSAIGSGGRKKRSDSLLCAQCRRAKSLRHKMSVNVIAARSGSSDCGICKAPIDLLLNHPHLDCATIDHIIPFARGGTHAPENLQLAHLRCNVRKQARTDYVPT